MITDIIFYIVGAVAQVLISILGTITANVPVQIQQAFNFAFSAIRSFQGIFPVDQLILAFSFIGTVWVGMLLLKILIMGINLIPGIHVELPRHSVEMRDSRWVDSSGKTMRTKTKTIRDSSVG